MKTLALGPSREWVKSGVSLIATFLGVMLSLQAFAELIPVSVWPTNTVLRTGSGGSFEMGMSPDARFVLFASSVNHLVTNDSGGVNLELFLRDRSAGRTILVSASADGNSGGKGTSTAGQLTDDGRFVVFESTASNLVANDTNGAMDVFLRDTQLGTTELVSRGLAGAANGDSSNPTVSSDGQFIAFESVASNLISGDTNALSDVFVYDSAAKAVSLVSGGTNGLPLNGTESHAGQITTDGKAAIFWSKGTNLVIRGTSLGDVYYRDLVAQKTYWVSTNAQALIKSTFSASNSLVNNLLVSLPAATPDGRYIAYKMSFAFGAASTRTFVARHDMSTFTTMLISTNANSGAELDDPNLSISADGKRIAYSGGGTNIYVWDADTGENRVVNLNAGGSAPGNGIADAPGISADGTKVVFLSNAQDLAPQQTDGFQYYIRDLALNSTHLINVGADNTGADVAGSTAPFLSADGRYVFFSTPSGNVVAGDQNNDYDVFLRDVSGESTELVSAIEPASFPQIAPGLCADCQNVVTDDGNLIIFISSADLTSIPVLGVPNIYRRDITNQTTLLVSVSSDGLRGANLPCSGASLSGNGNVVIFFSAATNLTARATNQLQIFARNISANTTTLVSVDQNGGPASALPYSPSVDFEGRRVVFASTARNLVSPSVNNIGTYLRDLVTAQTSLLSPTAGGGEITPDGRFAAAIEVSTVRLTDLTRGTFTNYPAFSFSFSHNSQFFVAVGDGGTPTSKVFIKDLQQNIDTFLSITNIFDPSISDSGQELVGLSQFNSSFGPFKTVLYDRATKTLSDVPISLAHVSVRPPVSPNGRYIAYETASSGSSMANDTNLFSDVALYDTKLRQLRLISVSASTGFAADSLSLPRAVLDDGSIVFESFADDLAAGGTFGLGAIYLYRNTFTDTDHDGLDDLLEMSLFGSLAQNATGDFDGDGISNGDEINAGTNPAGPDFRVRSLTVSSSSPQAWSIVWNASPGATFRVQYKHSISDTDWVDASGNMTAPAGATSLSFSDTNNLFTDAKYYRVIQLQ